MSLLAIVRALGGDLYAGGRRANVPAPGHSAEDRSVSLLLDGERVIVHAFAPGVGWREVLADLRRRGLVDARGQLVGGSASSCVSPPGPARPERIARALELWTLARPLRGTMGERHLRLRAVAGRLPEALRFHPAAALSAYRNAGATYPALIAAVRDAGGALTAVELTYLAPDGRRARMKLPRKVVGCVPAGSAVRLDPPAEVLVVAEGVFSALSAREALGLPAWALLSAGNLARWSAPAGVRRVLVAADRGRAGEAACAQLLARLSGLGVAAEPRWPPQRFGDWNEAAATAGPEGERRDGQGGPEGTGGPDPAARRPKP